MYADMRGGSFILPPAVDPMEAAWHEASHMLGTERCDLIVSEYRGRVWFLAVPSGTIAPDKLERSPVSAALPGTKMYRGPGAYLLSPVAGEATLLIIGETTIECFSMPQEQAIGKCEREALVPYNLGDIDPDFLLSWSNRNLQREKAAASAAVAASRLGWGLALVSMAMPAAAAAFGFFAAVDRDRVEAERGIATSQVMAMIAAAQDNPMATSMRRLSDITVATARMNGTLKTFSLKPDGTLQWSIETALIAPDALKKIFPAGNVVASPYGEGRMRITNK